MSNRFPMTPAGHRALKEELRRLLSEERPKNIEDITRAMEHGDLKENAEYHAAKERRMFINAELGRINAALAGAVVIDPTTLSGDRVVFGATVSVYDVDSEDEATYTIVGAHEADPSGGRLSIESPLVRAMIGKEEGDEVRIPGGPGRPERTLEITEVQFV